MQPMALSLRPVALSSAPHRARLHLTPVFSSVRHPARTSLRGSLKHYRVWSAFWNQKDRSTRQLHSQKNQPSLCVRCSLQGGATSDQPIGNRQGRSPKWILFAAAGVVVAGLFIFLRMKGRGVATSVAAEVPVFQATPGLVTSSPEGVASFHVKVPGIGNLYLGEVTPGWVYFLLLMAAGFGLFVSEEALNVWVGASLGRSLTYGSWEALSASLSTKGPFILSTVLWVYWGVCISDMVPFFAGKLASRRGHQLSEKLGVSKEQFEKVTGNIQRYGNLIGFVERFSIGIRNPTSFLAGFVGISPSRYFAGVCLGCLITLPIQMSIGFVLRERPVAALAGVAAAVAAWTVFPYVAAALLSTYYLLLHKFVKPSH